MTFSVNNPPTLNLTPRIIIGSAGNSSVMSQPGGIVFDERGNLWVHDQCHRVAPTGSCQDNEAAVVPSVIAFSPAQLVTSGNPLPRVVLSNATGRRLGYGGLVFQP